ncbi:hypothetical protein [Spirosoma validum]|uniref:Uncharacterized protein n=1 Tax=Spirosoma validum TaxID=2771355 RepID=A0A927AYU7_9BACT|nr:hypothetical protein [Spirosoma validum]MBD2752187.1 hypothetical protein [Spirosoma validum]
MKKIIVVVIGSLLFIAGYSYTRRQAEYAAIQNSVIKPTQAKIPVLLPFKSLPTFGISTERGHV